MGPVMGNLGQVGYSLTACIGGILCVLRGFDIGGLTVFVNYSRQFSRPINELSMQMNTIFPRWPVRNGFSPLWMRSRSRRTDRRRCS